MNLVEMSDLLGIRFIGENQVISNLAYDSREIEPGGVFFAIKGQDQDGHEYIEKAIQNGAIAIVGEEDLTFDIPYFQVFNTKKALAVVSNEYYQTPSKDINLVGVIGTNGKTTITYLIQHVFECLGVDSGLIGTNGSWVGQKKKATHTTPMSLDLNDLLKEGVKHNLPYLVMEVSSHALSLKRVENLFYKIGIFTNLTEDHLDFHKTFENYRKAKESLFFMTSKANIINIDDINGRIILENVKKLRVPCITYGINYDATFKGEDVKLYDDKTVFTLKGPNNLKSEITLNMVGQFTVYNVLAVICACYVLNMDINETIEDISQLKSVSGRFEKVKNDKNLNIFVDYAHTPDALDNVLKSIKSFVKGKIITVFGCGGNREKEKRPIMGQISQKYSDLTIITSDNPRYENPENIIKDILEGIDRSKDDYLIIEDRKEAIRESIYRARKGDIILIAGKGHENYQRVNDNIFEFDDKQVAKEIINEMN